MQRRLKLALIPLVSLTVLGGAAFLPVGGEQVAEATLRRDTHAMNLSQYPAHPPGQKLDLLFLHHSVGEQLLASTAEDPEHGGSLRELLTANDYVVHEATYGSALGEHTDLFDWLPKFRDRMADLLATDTQDRRLSPPNQNRIVLFKSCYPNNDFVGEGEEPGNPAGPELTIANAKATFVALRDELAKRPDVLFVYLTAPPRAPGTHPEPLWKRGARKLVGKPTPEEKLLRSAALARAFNQWVVSPEGWLSGYPHRNVVVFDLYGTLSEGRSLLAYPTGGGRDSHPASEGSRKAAALLVPFLNRSVRRAGLLSPER